VERVPASVLGAPTYGPRFPMNPGDFFQPLSIVMAVSVVAALICGWKAPRELRLWLWLPVIMFLIIWAITPTVFWPMVRELYGSAIGRISHTDAELVRLVHRWIVWDWLRVSSSLSASLHRSAPSVSLPRPMDLTRRCSEPLAGVYKG
jgi:hypothetical protein